MNEQSYFWKNGGLQFMENFFLIILMILNGFLGVADFMSCHQTALMNCL